VLVVLEIRILKEVRVPILYLMPALLWVAGVVDGLLITEPMVVLVVAVVILTLLLLPLLEEAQLKQIAVAQQVLEITEGQQVQTTTQPQVVVALEQ
jgi:hypothetical protein